ncbi:MAG: sugar phosphate isomerase/epimerase [Clostridia bacterium]|nr:sugar phosphate isomerase/epimerase [Clostridia bacterium]
MLVSIYSEETIAKYGVVEGYKRLKDAGFEAIDWSCGRVWGIRATTAARALPDNCLLLWDIEKIIERFQPDFDEIKKNGLVIGQAHAPIAIYIKGQPSFQKQIEQANINMLKLCGHAKIPYLVIHAPNRAVDDDYMTYAELWQATIERFAPLIPTIKETGVKVLLESCLDGSYHRFAGARPLYIAGPCCDPYEACEIIDTLNKMAGEECFGLCLDTGHLNLAKRRMRPYVDIVGSRIKALHVHDSSCVQDDHFVPEMGTIDWNDLIDGLRAINYRGNINFERSPEPYENDLVKYGKMMIERILK